MNKLNQFIEEMGRVPVVPLVGNPGAPLIGKTLKECLTDAPTQIKALLTLCDAIKPDALFAMMDLTVEAEFLGCGLNFPENDPPAVRHPVLTDVANVEKVFADRTIGGRMPLFAEVVSGLKQAIDIPVCAYVIGPLTLAGEIMDLVRVMKATRKAPGVLHQVLAKSTELIINYVKLLEDAGADLICILEPSAMMISPSLFPEFSGQYCRKIISEGITKMSVLHICGDTNHLIPEMLATGPDGLSLDKQINMPDVYPKLNNNTVLIGNIDPVSVVTLGEPGAIRKQSEEMIKAMAGNKNFIFSTGCDVPQDAPLENLKAMMSVRDL
jgi:uroporphyrinogen decarboxylase